MTPRTTIGQIFKNARKSQDWTHTEVAQKAHITMNIYSHIERNVQEPSLIP